MTAGTVSATVPVTVEPAPANLFPDFTPLLPYTSGGITFKTGPTPGSVHVSGTAGAWEQVQKWAVLDAGVYRLSGLEPQGWAYGVRVNDANGVLVMATTSQERMTASLAAGKYMFILFANTGTSVDATFTPVFTRIGDTDETTAFIPYQLN